MNVFMNTTENNFIILTDKLGRYALTGESKSAKCKSNAGKQFRLVTFCSSSITNNDFSMRIYCIDSLLAALQEVLNDEKKIGGTLLNISEPFAASHSHDTLSICIDELLPNSLNCKYNVNRQDIPLTHVWNRKNHLLHCTFTFEINNSLDKQFHCKLKAYQSHIGQPCVAMNVDFNLSNVKIFFVTNKFQHELY